MSAATAIDVRKITSFGLVGALTTGLYVVVFWTLTAGLGAPVLLTSVLAYAASASISYIANKTITFRSKQAHAVEAPRFALASLTGVAIATLGPVLLIDVVGLSRALALAIVCIAVPAQNFLLMNHLVFRNFRNPKDAALGGSAAP